MSTCPHSVLVKLVMPPAEDGELSSLQFEDSSHSWYRCQVCRQVIFLAMTLEYRIEHLKRIIRASEG